MKNTVKLILINCLFLISFTLNGCKKLNIEKELIIDIESIFNNDFITIKLDNDIIFSESVTTISQIGFAEIIKRNYPIGNYNLTVKINDFEITKKLEHKEGRIIKIDYDKKTSKITISYPDKIPMYD